MLLFDSALFAYPWDVLDDPNAPEEIASLGINTVSLAAVYHTTRALSPHNPRRKIVHAEHAAAYFLPDAARYQGMRLAPMQATWVQQDSFGTACRALQRVGLRVNAWAVICHNSYLGQANPDLVIQNAFGDPYTYALCPAQPRVRAYAAALVGDLVTHYALNGLELEACGYMGVEHLSHHEKVGVHLDLFHKFLLSLCFCPACCDCIKQRGLNCEIVRAHVVKAIEKFFDGVGNGADEPEMVDQRLEELFGVAEWNQLAAARDDITCALLDEIRAQILNAQNLPLILAAASSRHQTGACIGAEIAVLAQRATALFLAPYGETDDDASEHVRRMARASNGRAPVYAGVRACPPDTNSKQALYARVHALCDAGAQSIRFYHYGLCSRPNLKWIQAAVTQ